MRTALVAWLLTASIAAGQEPFEAVLSTHGVAGCYITPFPLPPHVQWVRPDRIESGTDVLSLASADGESVLALVSGDPMRIARIGPGGWRTAFFSSSSDGFGELIAVAPDGRVFVATNNQQIVVISPDATKQATYPLPGFDFFFGFLSVSPDGCTLFYSKAVGVGRINACTGAVLPDFPLADQPADLEPLPDGNVLAAYEHGNLVVLHDSLGAVIRLVASLDWYDLEGEVFAHEIAVSPDGRDLWIAALPVCDGPRGYLLRVFLADGRELSRREVWNTNNPTGLVAGLSHDGEMDIPTIGRSGSLLLTLTLAFACLFLLRR